MDNFSLHHLVTLVVILVRVVHWRYGGIIRSTYIRHLIYYFHIKVIKMKRNLNGTFSIPSHLSLKWCQILSKEEFNLIQVWPDVGVKSSTYVFKSCLKIGTAVFTQEWGFSNLPKKLLIIWATFVRFFAAKNFKRSPNLVTL